VTLSVEAILVYLRVKPAIAYSMQHRLIHTGMVQVLIAEDELSLCHALVMDRRT